MRQTEATRPAKSTRALPLLLATAVLLVALLVGCGADSQALTDTSLLSGDYQTSVQDLASATFTTEDGLVLNGRTYGASGSSATQQTTRWVILCHMYPADQTSWAQEAESLANQGYRVLTFDFRGYGSSEGQKDIRYLDRDVAAAVQYVRESGAEEVVLVGASMGGTASLVAAGRLQTLSSIRIAGVATFSAPAEFNGLSAIQATADLVIPMLIVAAENDSAADAARQLDSLPGDNAELHLLPGSDHGTDLFLGDQAEAARQLFFDFVRGCMPMGG